MFYIACVLYNTRVRDIVSLETFLPFCGRHDDVKIIILDNSDAPFLQDQDLPGDCILYIRNPSNWGLSKSYNRVLDMTDASDWIFWSDDDTFFSTDYLENVYHNVKACKSSVLSGTVRTQDNSVMSPFYRGIWPRPFCPAEGSFVKGAVCINSGLCIKRAVYEVTGKYNEEQFLDMLDYWLFDELEKRGLDRVFLVPGIIRQKFSALEETDRVRALNRYRIFKKDFLAYCKAEDKGLLYQSVILMKRRLNIFLKTKRTAA